MPSTYSNDLRQSIIAHVLKGHSRRETARVFGVSASFVVELLRRHQNGEVTARPRGGARNIKLLPFLDDLVAWIREQPDITLPMMVEKLLTTHGVKASPAGVSLLLRRSGYTYKKIHAGQRGRAWQAPGKA